MGILIEKESATFTENNLSEVEIAHTKYKNHPSINAITKRIKNLSNFTFSFMFISHDDVVKELNKLKSKKASQKTNIPVKIVKENVDIMSHFQYHNFNNSLACSTFPTGMKYADETPIYEKDDKPDKTNYPPVSILPNLSKVYKRLMYNQISPYFDSVFSKFQCGFWKCFGFEKRLLEFIHFIPVSVNKEPKLTLPVVPGKCYSQVFHKGQF